MKVSIIVPVYNTERYLVQCIESIISQTYKDFEVILVDDGSTDKSYEICEKYIKIDSRFNLISKVNGGVSSARNRGLELAAGEYIMFIDSDDYISSEMIDIMLSTIEQYNTDMVVCGYANVLNGNVDKLIFEKALYKNKEDIARFFSLLEGRTNSPCNKIYRRGLIKKKFDENLVVGEDLIFNINYISDCKTIAVIDKVLYYYRRDNQSSLTHFHHKNFFDINLYLHERLKKYINESSDRDISFKNIDKYFFRNLVSVFIGLINSSDYSKKTKKQKIKEMCNNNEMRKIIFNIEHVPIKYNLLRVLIKYRMALLIYILLTLWSSFKKTRKTS